MVVCAVLGGEGGGGDSNVSAENSGINLGYYMLNKMAVPSLKIPQFWGKIVQFVRFFFLLGILSCDRFIHVSDFY